MRFDDMGSQKIQKIKAALRAPHRTRHGPAEARTRTPSVPHTLPVESCWQSGGPDWLFTVVMGGALVALLGNSVRLDLNKPQPPSPAKRLPLSLGLLGLLALLMHLSGGVLWPTIGVAAFAELLMAGLLLAAKTPVTATGHSNGPRRAARAVPSSTHLLIGTGTVAAATAALMMLVGGGPC